VPKKTSAGRAGDVEEIIPNAARRAASSKSRFAPQSRPDKEHPANDSKKTAPRPAAERPVVAVVDSGPVAKPTTHASGFKTNEYIVVPAHVVGQTHGHRERSSRLQARAVSSFVPQGQDDACGVPVSKIATVGMRKLARVLVSARSRRSGSCAHQARPCGRAAPHEYEAKINSGDIVAIAEVVRDLFRSDTQPEQSYSPSGSFLKRPRPALAAKSRR